MSSSQAQASTQASTQANSKAPAPEQTNADYKSRSYASAGVAAGMTDGPQSEAMLWQTSSQAAYSREVQHKSTLPLLGNWSAKRSTEDNYPLYTHQPKFDKL